MSLTGLVQQVLTEGCMRKMNFRCGHTRVYTAGYAAIAARVGNGEIRVSTETVVDARGVPIGGSAFYAATDSSGNARADTFYLRPQINLGQAGESPPSIIGKALLVHEATHALQDYHAGGSTAGGRRDAMLGMTRIEAETAAYLAQALYYRINGGSFSETSRGLREARGGMSRADRRAGDRLLDALEPVAERLYTSPAYHVEDAEYVAIHRAVAAYPIYVRHGSAVAGFDGITAHHSP